MNLEAAKMFLYSRETDKRFQQCVFLLQCAAAVPSAHLFVLQFPKYSIFTYRV